MKKWLKIIEVGISVRKAHSRKNYLYCHQTVTSEELTIKGEKAGGDSGDDPETQTVPWPWHPLTKLLRTLRPTL
jgi:hypothetical protein